MGKIIASRNKIGLSCCVCCARTIAKRECIVNRIKRNCTSIYELLMALIRKLCIFYICTAFNEFRLGIFNCSFVLYRIKFIEDIALFNNLSIFKMNF
jgi:hypothetical protein